MFMKQENHSKMPIAYSGKIENKLENNKLKNLTSKLKSENLK